jgi:transketolase
MLQTIDINGPIYIRLGKGGDPIVSRDDLPCHIGKAIPMREGKDALLITTGVCLQIALAAAEALDQKGIQTCVLHLHTVKPLDKEAILSRAKSATVIVSIEEHTVIGGLGSAVAELLAEADFDQPKRFKRIGIPDVFPDQYGSQASLMARYGITPEKVVETVAELSGYP